MTLIFIAILLAIAGMVSTVLVPAPRITGALFLSALVLLVVAVFK